MQALSSNSLQAFTVGMHTLRYIQERAPPVYSRSAQTGPRWLQEMAGGSSKMAQDGSEMASRWPLDGLKIAPDGSKKAQDGSKMAAGFF